MSFDTLKKLVTIKFRYSEEIYVSVLHDLTSMESVSDTFVLVYFILTLRVDIFSLYASVTIAKFRRPMLDIGRVVMLAADGRLFTYCC